MSTNEGVMSARGWRVRVSVAPGAVSGNDRGSGLRAFGEVGRVGSDLENERGAMISSRFELKQDAPRAFVPAATRTPGARTPSHRVDVLLLLVYRRTDRACSRAARSSARRPPCLQVRRTRTGRDFYRLGVTGRAFGTRSTPRRPRGGRRRVHLLHAA